MNMLVDVPNIVISPDKMELYKYYKINYCRGLWKACRTDLNVVEIIQVDMRDGGEMRDVEGYSYAIKADASIIFDVDDMKIAKPYKAVHKSNVWKIVRTDPCIVQMIRFNESDISHYALAEVPRK